MDKKFEHEKINSYTTYTNECYEQFQKDPYSGMMRGEARVTLSNFIFTHMLGKESFYKEFKRPSFLDWLLRRKRIIHFEVDIKEILPNPPKKRKYNLQN